VAGSTGVWLAFFPSLLSGLPGRGKLGTERASREPCADGSKDPLARDEFSLLVGVEARAPPPPLGSACCI